MSDLLSYAQVVQGCYDANSVPTWEDDAKLTHVYHVIVNGVDHFNFQGTIDTAEWCNRNLDAIGLESFEHPDFGLLHDGFARGALAMVPKIASRLAESNVKTFTIGGHSKGAGEAQVAAAELKRLGLLPSAVYLFEPPRAGTATLRAYLSDLAMYGTKTFNDDGADLVTEVPEWPWVDVIDLDMLKVSDSYDIATKHKIPAVIEALKAM